MQVILVKTVRKLGSIGQVVKVANGYARNYLVPQKLAIRATDTNIKRLVHIQKELEAKNTENKKAAEKIAELVDGKHLNFIIPSSTDGKLFGSLNLRTLASEISKITKTKLNYSNIILDNPIKFNGVYTIQVILHPEVSASILVVVAKTESEAQNALVEFEKNVSTKELETRSTSTELSQEKS